MIDILLVEDDEADARAARRAMKSHTEVRDVHHCTNGNSALEFLRNDADGPRVHIVVLDLGLPGMSGLEVLREMKSDIALNSTPVVVLSDSSNPTELMEVYRLGAAAFLRKPDQVEGYKNILDGIIQFWLLATLPLESQA